MSRPLRWTLLGLPLLLCLLFRALPFSSNTIGGLPFSACDRHSGFSTWS